MIRRLLKLDEPRLLFKHGQAMEDPPMVLPFLVRLMKGDLTGFGAV